MFGGRFPGRCRGGTAGCLALRAAHGFGGSLAWIGLLWLPALPVTASGRQPCQAAVAIELFERTVAGSYRLARIESSGRAHDLQFQRRIQQARQGELRADTLAALLALVRGAEFGNLEESYDLERVSGAPQRLYEDVYYRLRIESGDGSRLVVAHQHAAPPILEEVVTTALRGLRALPRRTLTGPQLIVVEAEIARQIRWFEWVEPVAISLDEVPRTQYPLLRQAAESYGRPLPFPPGGEPEIRERLSRERQCLDLVDRGRRLAACVLGVESDHRQDSRR